MMRMSNIKMVTKVERKKLLATLRDNLSRHKAIVQEAREGYVQRARQALERRLEMVRRGEVVSLTFTLTPPADYTEVYVNSIEMLEWNTEEYVELAADEFRQLVRDEWEWRDSFLHSNATYSKRAKDWADELVGGALVAPPD